MVHLPSFTGGGSGRVAYDVKRQRGIEEPTERRRRARPLAGQSFGERVARSQP
jgi:hypothetical protein